MTEKTRKPSQADIAKRFRDVVDIAVQPIRDQQERGMTAVYTNPDIEVQRDIPTDKTNIIFSVFREDAVGHEGGVQGLPFTPSHAIEVVTRKSYGSVDTQTMFGLAEDDVVVRSHLVRGPIMGTSVNRALDLEESAAIIDYASSPHLNEESLAIATRLTEGEEASIKDGLAREAAAAEKLRANLDAISTSQREVWRRPR